MRLAAGSLLLLALAGCAAAPAAPKTYRIDGQTFEIREIDPVPADEAAICTPAMQSGPAGADAGVRRTP